MEYSVQCICAYNIMVLFLGIYIRDYWTDKPRNNNLFVLTPMLALYSTAT